MYSDGVLEHYRMPRGRGTLPHPDAQMTDTNPLCGDSITVHLAIENGVIAQARHQASGCAVSQAAASMLFERLEGMPIADALTLSREGVLEPFGQISLARVKCALLPLAAVKKALVVWEARHA